MFVELNNLSSISNIEFLMKRYLPFFYNLTNLGNIEVGSFDIDS